MNERLSASQISPVRVCPTASAAMPGQTQAMQIGHRPTRPATTHRPEPCRLRDRRYRMHCKKQELLALLYQAEKAIFIYEIGLKSLKNAFPEVCWGFRRLVRGCLGAFFWFFCLFFRIELAFCAFIKSASSSYFLLCFLKWWGSCLAGLGWAGLGWAGLGWAGLGWVGLGGVGWGQA